MIQVRRDPCGQIGLWIGSLPAPVRPDYLEEVLRLREIAVPTGVPLDVDASVALDALEEAFASVGYEIRGAEARKRLLLRLHRIVLEAPTDSKDVA